MYLASPLKFSALGPSRLYYKSSSFDYRKTLNPLNSIFLLERRRLLKQTFRKHIIGLAWSIRLARGSNLGLQAEC